MTTNQKVSQVIGILLVCAGLLTNEWVLAKLFSPDGVLNTSTRLDIAIFDLTCLSIGFYLWLRKDLMILVKLIFSFFTIVVVLSVLEITVGSRHGMMFRDNPNGTGSYRLKPNFDDGAIHTNAFGMRWRNVKQDRAVNKKRIAFIGDSFAFGCCADSLDKSFVGLFDSQMSSRNIETLNFGVPGFGVADYYLLLQEDVLPFHPDFVVLMFFNGNDFRDTYLAVEKDRILGRNRKMFFNAKIPPRYKGTRIQEITDFLTNRELYRLWIQALENFRKRPSPERKQYLRPTAFQVDQRFMSYSFWSQKVYPPVAGDAKNLSLYFLQRMFEACLKANSHLVIVTIPFREQVYSLTTEGKNYDIAFPQKYVADFAAAHAVPYLDLLPELRDYALKSHNDLYFLEDPHFTNEGHRVTSQLLVRFFEESERL